LYLRAAPGANDSVNRSWIYRYSVSGKDHQLSLGTYPDVSLAEAREKAVEQRKARGNGLDPIALRRQKERVDNAADEAQKTAAALAAARSKTFKACADEYITAHERGWSSLHYRTRWRRTLEMFAYPLIGNLPVADVDETLVLRILEPHWKTKITTAKVLRARLAKVLGYAAARGYRPRGPNPAAWADNLNHSLPKPSQVRPTRHHPALDYQKVGAFMMKLRQDPWIGARALEFTILTASRTGTKSAPPSGLRSTWSGGCGRFRRRV
jgi:hypothetical protein